MQWYGISLSFHAVIVFGLGFDFSFSLVSSVPKNRDIRGLYYSSLIFPTPTTWPFCRPADRHLHVRAWLSSLLISVTMKTTKWKWCEQSWSIRKKKRKKKSTKTTTNWSKQHSLSKLISKHLSFLFVCFFNFAWMTQTTIPFHYIITHLMGKIGKLFAFFKTKLFVLKDFSNNGVSFC